MTDTVLRDYAGTGLTLEQLDALPREDRNAIVVGTISMLRETIDRLKAQLSEAESLIREDMRERNASLMVAGEFEVKLTEKTRWEFDTEGLVQIPDVVNLSDRERDLFKKAVRPTVTINKTHLNALAKYGGNVGKIIEQCTWKKLIGFDLDLRRLVR